MAQRVTSSRFVGRQRELADLQRTLAGEDPAGLPALFFISGESGVGKTRLLHELIATAEQQGARAIGGACVELGEDELPYAPLVGALRPLQRSCEPVLEQVSAGTRAELARLNPEIGEPSTEPETERGEAQRRLFDAFLELTDRLAEERPVLLWIEDIHWADRSTRSFLRFLAASLTSRARRSWSPPTAPTSCTAATRCGRCSPSSSAPRGRGGSSSSASTAPSSPTSSPTSSARAARPRWSSGCTGAATATRCSPRS